MSATAERMAPWYRAALDRNVPWPDEPGEQLGQPRRFTASMLLQALPGIERQMRVVPAEYTADVDHERVVACVCGRRPVLGLGEMRTCARARAYVPTRAGCDRTFLASRTVVFVLGGPRS